MHIKRKIERKNYVSYNIQNSQFAPPIPLMRFTIKDKRIVIKRFFLTKTSSSFTLIELLIVIAILAVLMSVIVVSLNPAEMLKRTRDVRRQADLKAINSALLIYSVSNPNGFFGSSTIVYISIPSNYSNCSDLGLPPLPSGWSYHCSNADNYRKIDGSGWIPVNFNSLDVGAPISALPIDPINSTTSGNYYTYVTGGSWELTALFESQKYRQESAPADGGDVVNGFEVGNNLTLTPIIFPHNWIKVPGSSLYGTNDFWVMQFEAKYSKTGSGADDAGACYYTSAYDTWDWGKTGTDCPSSWSNTNVVSSPYGSPIAGVTHNEAKAICQSLGGHLITNQEWMTIVRNAEQVEENWSGGSVGSGCLFRGNVGSNDACGYDGANPEKGINRNPKAKLILSNNEEIWDMAGNVWEHVMKDLNDTLVNNHPTILSDNTWKWSEHTASWTSYGDLSYNEIRPSNSSWNANQGMGRIYHYDGYYSGRVLLRGGCWGDGGAPGRLRCTCIGARRLSAAVWGFAAPADPREIPPYLTG